MGTILIPLYVPQKILAVDWKSLVKLGKLKKKARCRLLKITTL
jgi:hypothetical protein